ncbi:hypothetical protein BDZ94DRAFT_83102 [Collybia nuda]|uniref:F-box domain-containing protein n=1 Tax=Collybia nuda TaxID=64659 RepID=A0A9P5XXU6_9AGAR|nr:hypothetical protein BDZ94DRAFT_83102 [Collybia nuda]
MDIRDSATRQEDPLYGYPVPRIPASNDVVRDQMEVALGELRGLDVELTLILARRSQVISRLNRCRMVLAPYKRLPPELITKIILFCVPKLPMKRAIPRKRNLQPLLRVTQICSAWRKIAFSESALWDVCIRAYGRHVELAAAWFRQCSCSSLALVIKPEMRNGSYELQSLLPAVNRLIVPYSKKLRFVGLTVDKPLLNYILSFPLENLVEISLFLDFSTRKAWEEVEDLQLGTPATSLRWADISVPPGIVDDRFFAWLPLQQLTNLDWSGYLVAVDVAAVLAKCHSLERCSIGSVFEARSFHGDFPRPIPDTPIRLPHLRYLSIVFSGSSGKFLSLLEAPNITSLVLDVDLSSPGCLMFCQRLINLHRIDIGRVLPPEMLVDEDFISSISPVKEIYASSWSFHPSTLIKIGEGDLLPKVKYLEFDEDNLQLVLDMLSKRYSAARAHPECVSHIKKIKISCNNEEGDFEGAFDVLRLQGIDITITWITPPDSP